MATEAGRLRCVFRYLLAVGITAVVMVTLGTMAFVAMGEYLAVDRTPARADVGVVLAGDYARALFAAELYHESLIPLVWITRPVRERPLRQVDALGIAYPRQEDISRAVLLGKGVPGEAIEFIGSELVNTLAEARALAAVLAKRKTLTRVLVIAGRAHVRRAEAIFHDAFASLPDVRVRVVGTPYDGFVADRWWTDRDSARQVVLETVKLIVFWLVTDLE